jgi:hypothetical protein
VDREAVLRAVDLDQLVLGSEQPHGLTRGFDRDERVFAAMDHEGGRPDIGQRGQDLEPEGLVEQRPAVPERRGELDEPLLVKLPSSLIAA